MEKFMLLFRGSEVYQANQSPEALQILTQKMINWVGEISEKGLHVSSEKLKRTGKLVRASNKSISDHTIDDTVDMVGGCTIIQAKDMEGALEIAKRCPILETHATIEIRPILNF
jgi:hypothetical protein